MRARGVAERTWPAPPSDFVDTVPTDQHPTVLDDETLLAACDVRRQRRSGPGGQHRNKVETAVIIRHLATGITGEASERRSQAENHSRALFRLRVNLALGLRGTAPRDAPSDLWAARCRQGKVSISSTHQEFPQLLAEVLDVLHRHGLDVGPAAAQLGCTHSQLVKFLQLEMRALEQVNRYRTALGLRRLR